MSITLRLAPPWYFLRNEVSATLGQDPNLEVSALIPINENEYEIRISVLNYFTQAAALRKIIKPEYILNNKTIRIKIFSKQSLEIPYIPKSGCYTPKEIGTLLDNAFVNNPLYKGYVLTSDEASINRKSMLGDIIMVVSKEVIQFFNDDISDLYLNFNGLAAEVFKDFIIQEYPCNIKLSFSTYDYRFYNRYSNL